jgi:hypothetical protein
MPCPLHDRGAEVTIHELQQASRKLESLALNPEPGMSTWWQAVKDVVDELNRFYYNPEPPK